MADTLQTIFPQGWQSPGSTLYNFANAVQCPMPLQKIYGSPTGNDSNSGTTSNKAIKTIDKMICKKVNGYHTTIELQAGTYNWSLDPNSTVFQNLIGLLTFRGKYSTFLPNMTIDSFIDFDTATDRPSSVTVNTGATITLNQLRNKMVSLYDGPSAGANLVGSLRIIGNEAQAAGKCKIYYAEMLGEFGPFPLASQRIRVEDASVTINLVSGTASGFSNQIPVGIEFDGINIVSNGGDWLCAHYTEMYFQGSLFDGGSGGGWVNPHSGQIYGNFFDGNPRAFTGLCLKDTAFFGGDGQTAGAIEGDIQLDNSFLGAGNNTKVDLVGFQAYNGSLMFFDGGATLNLGFGSQLNGCVFLEADTNSVISGEVSIINSGGNAIDLYGGRTLLFLTGPGSGNAGVGINIQNQSQALLAGGGNVSLSGAGGALQVGAYTLANYAAVTVDGGYAETRVPTVVTVPASPAGNTPTGNIVTVF